MLLSVFSLSSTFSPAKTTKKSGWNPDITAGAAYYLLTIFATQEFTKYWMLDGQSNAEGEYDREEEDDAEDGSDSDKNYCSSECSDDSDSDIEDYLDEEDLSFDIDAEYYDGVSDVGDNDDDDNDPPPPNPPSSSSTDDVPSLAPSFDKLAQLLNWFIGLTLLHVAATLFSWSPWRGLKNLAAFVRRTVKVSANPKTLAIVRNLNTNLREKNLNATVLALAANADNVGLVLGVLQELSFEPIRAMMPAIVKVEAATVTSTTVHAVKAESLFLDQIMIGLVGWAVFARLAFGLRNKKEAHDDRSSAKPDTKSGEKDYDMSPWTPLPGNDDLDLLPALPEKDLKLFPALPEDHDLDLLSGLPDDNEDREAGVGLAPAIACAPTKPNPKLKPFVPSPPPAKKLNPNVEPFVPGPKTPLAWPVVRDVPRQPQPAQQPQNATVVYVA
ncbi:hypothetical protein C0991_010440 [Blastosporella zonata]|nr:hypothetical protein C0991_010440 [Blastosporella zonata]